MKSLNIKVVEQEYRNQNTKKKNEEEIRVKEQIATHTNRTGPPLSPLPLPSPDGIQSPTHATDPLSWV
ncbi:hypothetical protein P8452_42324 [Trifolium repens]|nr:hypothetical protein P8452_42324 [Trifolium repens]